MDRKQNHCKNPALLNTFSSRRDVSTMKIRNFALINANFHFWANEKCDSIHVMLNGRKKIDPFKMMMNSRNYILKNLQVT